MRTRSIGVKVFGQEHELITGFPCNLATDLITLIESFRRGKQARLSTDRMTAVETELLRLDSSLQAIRHRIDELKQRSSEHFDANTYYDSARVSAYSDEFSEVQARHTSRCVFLLGSVPSNALVLDLGCGSGLSTVRLKRSFPLPIGLDASEAMLAAASASLPAADFVLADFNQRLPFRGGVFDYASSTSALHYVRPEILPDLLTQLHALVREAVTVQLFCRGGVGELRDLWVKNWPGCEARIFADRPHHKHDRYYLLLPCKEGRVGDCSAATPEGGCGVFDGCHCLLQGAGDWAAIEDGHQTWLDNEHGRFANRTLRLKRRFDQVEM